METTTTTTVTNPILQTVADDAVADAALIIRAVKAYKAGGKDALIALLPEAELLIHKEVDDIRDALPTIKAGWKTSEFWLALGVTGLIGGLAAAGHPLNIETSVILGMVSGLYAVIRSFIKKPVATA